MKDCLALTEESKLRVDNSDPIEIHPELNCTSSPRPCARDRNFSTVSIANAPNEKLAFSSIPHRCISQPLLAHASKDMAVCTMQS